jgi:hypothetical protein
MPTISEFFGILIRMYYDDHGSGPRCVVSQNRRSLSEERYYFDLHKKYLEAIGKPGLYPYGEQ